MIILDKKLKKELDKEHSANRTKVKRCMHCNKLLRKQNRSYLCTICYRRYHAQTQRIHRLIKKIKAAKNDN